LYWTNIPNVTQPDDRGIILNDIIEEEVDNKYYLTPEAIDYMSRLRNGKPRWEYHKNPIDGKAACLTANMHKGVPYGVMRITGAAQRGRYLVDGKRADHTVESMSGLTEQRIEFREDGKSNCLTSVQKDSLVGIKDAHICRKLTPIECERLQTFPDNWTEGISNSQRYKALGNSWTVDVVTHIFKNL
jgi:DNA (cytosine-5)-methyltransferase 3A